jgi:very-short-patch-repair endonuclease
MVSLQQLGKMTKPEAIGYSLLKSLGIDFLPQHVIAGKFCVDAFVPSQNLIVQFDGDYWHANPTRFPNPDKRQQRRIKLDLSQDAYMKKCGYHVIRLWETDLKKNLEDVKKRLLPFAVQQAHNPSAQG